MIEINFLKEGHGFLYEEAKSSILTTFSKIGIVLLVVIGSSMYLGKNYFLLSQDPPVMKYSGNIVQSGEKSKKIKSGEINRQEVASQKNDVPAPPDTSIKRNTNNVNTTEKVHYKVIAGTCLLRSSAENIVRKIKKSYSYTSTIEEDKVTMRLDAVWLGEYFSVADLELAKSVLDRKIVLEMVENEGKYVLRTASFSFAGKAKEAMKYFQSKGFSASLIKVKEKKDVFIVTVGRFSFYDDAVRVKQDLKKNNIIATIMKTE